VLQCVASCCSVLQCVASCSVCVKGGSHVLQCVVICCIVLQWVAVGFSVLHHVVVLCSILGCVTLRS